MLKGVGCNLWGLTKEKLEVIKGQAELENIFAMCFCETWLSDSVFDAEFNIPNYTPYRSDRVGRTHGGTACYVRNDFLVDHSKILRFSNSTCGCLALSINGGNIGIIVVYRPPNTKLKEFTEILIK